MFAFRDSPIGVLVESPEIKGFNVSLNPISLGDGRVWYTISVMESALEQQGLSVELAQLRAEADAFEKG